MLSGFELYPRWVPLTLVCQTRDHKSLIGKIRQTLLLCLWGNKTKSQTSKTSGSTARLSLAERWTITEIGRQPNSVLAYSLLTDVLPGIKFVKRLEGASVN